MLLPTPFQLAAVAFLGGLGFGCWCSKSRYGPVLLTGLILLTLVCIVYGDRLQQVLLTVLHR